MLSKSAAVAAAACVALAGMVGCASDNEARPVESAEGKASKPTKVDDVTFRPRQLKFDDGLLGRVKVPDGFKVNVFAKNLKGARMMVVGSDGTVYLSRREPGEVVAMRDADGDGVAEDVKPVAKVKDAHGLAIQGNRLYVAGVSDVHVMDVDAGRDVSEPRKIIDDLPDGGQHPNRTLGFGPDGKMYITVGSTCNACEETNPESATILVANADGTSRKPFAGGLRNTIGFGWHPVTKQMWGMDHGTDSLGSDKPREELNLLQEGKDYGWPYAYDDRQVHPSIKQPSDKRRGPDKETIAAKSEPPVMSYTAHAAPIGMVFYTAGMFPDEYQNDAFVAMHGSWNAYPAVGYSVVRVRYSKEGRPEKFEEFATGWLTEGGKSHFGRPAGVAVAKDGSLLVSDDANGVIYRISYERRVASAR
jgi:glucose/arabinose dehydrogenase